MSSAPEGAQLSDDGQWWWDGEAWQPVSPPSSDSDAASGESSAVEGDDRAQARAAQGLPQSVEELDDDQRGQLVSEPIVSVELVDSDQVEVLAMAEGDEDGGSYA